MSLLSDLGFGKNFLSDAVDGLLGNDFAKDYKHASKIFVSDYYRLAPKNKFLFHCLIRPKTNVFNSTGGRELNLLVKKADLPKFTIKTEEKNQYNKKTYAYTGIDYQPVNITFHDDSANLALQFWTDYYYQYFQDGGKTRQQYYRDLYNDTRAGANDWGLDGGTYNIDLLESIDIFTLSQGKFTMYSLQTPWITSFNHDSHDVAESSGLMEHSMQVGYSGVLYGQGRIQQGNPPGFADLLYDFSPSPISLRGGGTSSLFGVGGVLDGGLGVADDIYSGNITLGTLLNGARTVRNASHLSKAGITGEIGSLIKTTVQESPNNPLSRYTLPNNSIGQSRANISSRPVNTSRSVGGFNLMGR